MYRNGQIEFARAPDKSDLEERSFKTPSRRVSDAQVMERMSAIWGKLGAAASEPDAAAQKALERMNHTDDEAEALRIGCEALGSYDRGATLEFAELAHLTAMASGSRCVDGELPTALRQAARQALHTCLASPERAGESREGAARLLRQIEGDQISSEGCALQA